MPVIKDLVTDMESTHWTEDPPGDAVAARRRRPARARARGRRRSRWWTSRRRSPASSVAPASRRASRWRSTRTSSAPPRSPRPIASSAIPRDVETPRAPLRPRPGPARDLRLHALLQLRRRLPQGRRADGPDHAPAPCAGDDARHRRRQQRPPARDRLREDHREEGHAGRVAAAPGVLRAGRQGQADPEDVGDQGPAGLDPDRRARHSDREDALAAEADPGRPPEAPGRRAGAREAHLRARRGAPRGAQPLHHGRGGGRAGARRGDARRARRRERRRALPRRTRTDGRRAQARLLARLRLPWLHARAARVDGPGRRAPRHRAGRRSIAPTAAAPG